MSRKSYLKGAQGEREFLNLCARKLQISTLRRNLKQRQVSGLGDADRALAGFVIEIKRCERWSESFWTQALSQAAQRRCDAALAYRANGCRWLVMVPDRVLGVRTVSGRVLLEVDDWLAIVSERLRV